MIKHFWLCVALFLFVVFGVLGIAIWQTDKTSSFNKQAVSTPSTTPQRQDIKEPLEDLPANAPAPARKLQKLLKDAEQQLIVDAALEEKIQILDSTLVDIDTKLQAQGINTSKSIDKQAASAVSDTQERLQAIKNHLKNNNK